MAIDFSSPWLIREIEPEAAAVIGTFGVKAEALIDVIRGRYHPTGKLPLTIPANQKALNYEKGDIPGYVEDPSYPYVAKTGDRYVNGFGLSYSFRNKNLVLKKNSIRKFIK